MRLREAKRLAEGNAALSKRTRTPARSLIPRLELLTCQLWILVADGLLGRAGSGVIHCSERSTKVRDERPEFKFKLYHSLNWVPQASYVDILVTYPDVIIVKIKSRSVFEPCS